jgi:hypothetical protein
MSKDSTLRGLRSGQATVLFPHEELVSSGRVGFICTRGTGYQSVLDGHLARPWHCYSPSSDQVQSQNAWSTLGEANNIQQPRPPLP